MALSDHEYVDVLQNRRRQKVFSVVRESGKRSTRSVTSPIYRFVGVKTGIRGVTINNILISRKVEDGGAELNDVIEVKELYVSFKI